MPGMFAQDTMTVGDAIRELAGCIKDLSCIVEAGEDDFLNSKLKAIYEDANNIILKDRLI